MAIFPNGADEEWNLIFAKIEYEYPDIKYSVYSLEVNYKNIHSFLVFFMKF